MASFATFARRTRQLSAAQGQLLVRRTLTTGVSRFSRPTAAVASLSRTGLAGQLRRLSTVHDATTAESSARAAAASPSDSDATGAAAPVAQAEDAAAPATDAAASDATMPAAGSATADAGDAASEGAPGGEAPAAATNVETPAQPTTRAVGSKGLKLHIRDAARAKDYGKVIALFEAMSESVQPTTEAYNAFIEAVAVTRSVADARAAAEALCAKHPASLRMDLHT